MSYASQLGSGVNQSGSRAANERLMLTLLRRYGALSKAELARLTGLTAQTLSVIIKHLEGEGLVLPQEAQRGKVGQPSIPYVLNPESVYSLGVKIGRRSTQVVLVDFLGTIQHRASLAYAYPKIEEVFSFIAHEARLTPQAIGIGIAMPFEIWLWEDEMNLPPKALEAWRDVNVSEALNQRTKLPIFLVNDATAACAAELIQLKTTHHVDFLYFFIDWFIGGGVVLGGALYQGRTGNAGALGSMPLTTQKQLIQSASLLQLEKRLIAENQDLSRFLDPKSDWMEFGDNLEAWLEEASLSLAQAIAAGLAVIDFPEVHIDGIFPNLVREKLVTKTQEAFMNINTQGLSPVRILEGSMGREANVVGAAMMPILAAYATENKI